MNLTNRVLLAMGLGIVLGLIINLGNLNTPESFTDEYLINGLFSIVGTLFINALKMVVVPLVVFSMISGVCGIGDVRLLGRIGGKSFFIYLFTTAAAIALAVFVANLVGIGEGGMEGVASAGFEGKQAPPISDILLGIVPNNPIAAMAEGNMLAIIFFSVFFGVCLLSIKDQTKGLIETIDQLNQVMMKMVGLIMEVAPYAVFCLIAKVTANLGVDLLFKLAGYVAVLLSVLLLHLLVTLQLLLKILTGLNPFKLLVKIRAAQMFAFSTASSGATIPITLRTVTKRLGVDKSVASFTVPFGATINMDGTAMMQGVATIFIANIYGIDLGLTDFLIVIMMAVLASIGTAAIPSVGLVMLTMVFTQVGLPVEGIAIILGVDRLMDMARTAVNVSADTVVSTIVAKGEGKLDEKIYNDPEAGAIEE